MRHITRFWESRTTKLDVAMLVLRLSSIFYLTWTQGLLYGLLIYAFIVIAMDHIIVKSMNLEALNATDTNMWFDQESNRCNVMAALLFNKCSYDQIRTIFMETLPNDRSRFRSRLVRILDSYYFKELPADEYKR